MKKYRALIIQLLHRMLFGALIFLTPLHSFAHEQWFLTKEQMAALNAAPSPTLFTQFNAQNISIFIFTAYCIYLWVLLGRTGAKELFHNHQKYLNSYRYLASSILRLTTAMMLLIAVFGMNPRYNVLILSSPTLIFPDLQLNLLSPHWMWLKWLELGIAIALICEIYVRFMAFLLIAIGLLGIYLFGTPMIWYIGVVVGIGLYLMLDGPGPNKVYFSLPCLFGFKKIQSFLKNQPTERARCLLRICVGLTFTATGFVAKFLHPNLAIGLLTARHMPTFGLSITTVVFMMAIIETFSGVLLIFGALTRAVSFILIGCFTFMSFAINEPMLSHTIFYGALIACYINGSGRWNPAVAKDSPLKILILGGSISGIYAAMQLDKLIHRPSNIEVTLVHHENYFQFNPLLPEVIGGLVQPANIINPIRRISEFTHFIKGHVTEIRHHLKKVMVALPSGVNRIVSYDQLIIASDKVSVPSPTPGLDQYTIPIMNVGDALKIRNHINNCLETAETISYKKDRKSWLSFVIIGAGLRGCSVTAEIKNFIKSTLHHYPELLLDEIKITLVDRHKEILPSFGTRFSTYVHGILTKMHINIITNAKILLVSQHYICFMDGQKLYGNTIISALSSHPPLIHQIIKSSADKIELDDYLRPIEMRDIFVAGMLACSAKNIPYQVFYKCKLGNIAAYNALANAQERTLRKFKTKKPYFFIASLGKNASTIQFAKWTIKGRLAWTVIRCYYLFQLPGLEKNIRILIDWFFNIPFREDISTFSHSETQHVTPIPTVQKKTQKKKVI